MEALYLLVFFVVAGAAVYFVCFHVLPDLYSARTGRNITRATGIGLMAIGGLIVAGSFLSDDILVSYHIGTLLYLGLGLCAFGLAMFQLKDLSSLTRKFSRMVRPGGEAFEFDEAANKDDKNSR